MDAMIPKPEIRARRVSAFSGAPVKAELKELVLLAWPVILSRLGIMMMGFVDVVVVSHFSTSQLGYQALGWGPTAVVMTTAIGLVSGVQVMSSRHIGEGRPEATGGVFRRGLVFSFWFGMAAGALLYVFGPMLLHASGFTPDLAEGASRVLRVLAWSMPAQLIFTAATFYLEALSRPKPATLAMWVCNGINLGLNLLFVPGVFGLPAMGAEGAAWATFGSRGVLAIWLLIYIVRMPDARALGIFSKPIDGKGAAKEQLKVGYGASASFFVEVAAFNCMNFYAGWIGGLAVASWTIILNVIAFIFMFPLGLATATSVLVGRAYGAQDRRGVVRAGTLGFGLCLAMLGVISLVVVFAAPLIAGVYSTDLALLKVVTPALAFCWVFLILDGLQVVAAQSLRARGDVWLPTATHTFSYVAIMTPLSWVLAFPLHMELDGILWGMTIATVAAAALLVGRFVILARR